MRFEARGTSTSGVELIGRNENGVRFAVDGRERFLPFEQFPWFRDASVEQLANVRRPVPDHIEWPALDVDLHLRSIDDPPAYPLVSGAGGSGSGEE
jgi:hypothetical protein